MDASAKITTDMLRDMPPEKALYLIAREKARRHDLDKLGQMFPDSGEFRRELYPKHVAMLNAGSKHRFRVAFGGNRTGKTYLGAYEMALHLTGLYPHWWEGRRWEHPILAWACGTKSIKTRDVNQKLLLGSLRSVGGITTAQGGFIPTRMMGRMVRKSGITDAIDKVTIRNRKGWDNILAFKSYEEGRPAFEAEEVHHIWLDEEPISQGIYDECVMRTLTTNGCILSTMTPVEGMTAVVRGMIAGSDFVI